MTGHLKGNILVALQLYVQLYGRRDKMEEFVTKKTLEEMKESFHKIHYRSNLIQMMRHSHEILIIIYSLFICFHYGYFSKAFKRFFFFFFFLNNLFKSAQTNI